MGEKLGMASDGEPDHELETITGPELDGHFLGLYVREVSVLMIGGYRIVCVDNRFVDPESNTVTVECRDDELHPHRLTYTLEPGSPVAHEILKDRPDPRAEYA